MDNGPVPVVLVTGFEAFGPHTTNPTEAAMRLLPASVGGFDVVTGVLPVEYGRCGQAALELIEEHSPTAVVLTGLAAGRTAVTPERIAVNVRDTGAAEGFADNAGFAPVDVPIIEGGPDGIFASLPNREIVAALLAAGLPASLSESAGTYICNETLYAVLVSDLVPVAGFIHVPDAEVLPLPEVGRALGVALNVIIGTLPTPAPPAELTRRSSDAL